MSKTTKDIKSEHLDVFREIGNIGAGNATTSLAKMLDKRMDMSIPKAQLVPFNAVTDILNGPEQIVVGVMVAMSGDLKGSILLVLELADALEMTGILTGSAPQGDSIDSLNEMDLSALTEIANILVGSYLSAISSLTQLSIVPSVPDLVIDMAGAIMSVPLIEYGSVGDEVLMLETEFSDEGQAMAGHFFLVPDLDSYYVLMRSLGIEVDDE